MDAADVVVQEVAALLGRPMDADIGDRSVVLTPANGAQKCRRYPSTQSELGHSDHARPRCDRHDAGKDWYLDPRQVAALAEVVEVPVVKEELRTDVVGASVDLALQVLHLLQTIRRRRVS